MYGFKIYTLSVNLQGNLNQDDSYRIDELGDCVKKNIDPTQEKKKIEQWKVVGLADSLEEALKKSCKLRKILYGKQSIEFSEVKDIFEKLENEN